jgi:hypothetical protein
VLTLNVDDTVARARAKADLETADESTSILTDAELLEHINEGYRVLWDHAVELAPSLVTTNVVLPSPYTLPADYLMARGFDLTVGGHVRTLLPYGFDARNRYQYLSADYPRWEVSVLDGAVRWQPTEFTDTVLMWYVPVAPTLVAAGTYNAWHGWDRYLVYYALRCARDKQEYDLASAERALDGAERHVRRMLARLAAPRGPIEDSSPPDAFYRAG